MRQQGTRFWYRSNAVVAPAEADTVNATALIETAAENSPANALLRPTPGASHLQTAWRIRQFAGSAPFGSLAIPRPMSRADIAEVGEALDRLGPFSDDRVDNFARLHAGLISTNADSAHAVLTLVRHRIVRPNQRGPDGDTLLHSLVEYGRFHTAEGFCESAENSMRFDQRITELIAAGASFNATDRAGCTAFERILSSSRPDWQIVAKALVQIAPDEIYRGIVKNGPTLLHRAARVGDVTLVERWLALGLPSEASVARSCTLHDSKIWTPLHSALKDQTLEGLAISRMLIAHGADPYRCSTLFGNSMLHRAARDADMALIQG